MAMRRFALLCASALVLTICGAAKAERLASFICGERASLDKYQSKLDNSESSAAFHKEEFPWSYDRQTGSLYKYDDFEEALLPIKDYDLSSNGVPNIRNWMEFSSGLSKDGRKLRIKTVQKSKIDLPKAETTAINDMFGVDGDLEQPVIVNEITYIFDIEKNTIGYNVGDEDESIENCLEVPVSGIDVQWLEEGE